jgi:hypothetical protein
VLPDIVGSAHKRSLQHCMLMMSPKGLRELMHVGKVVHYYKFTPGPNSS